jgi:hypothetical protein
MVCAPVKSMVLAQDSRTGRDGLDDRTVRQTLGLNLGAFN